MIVEIFDKPKLCRSYEQVGAVKLYYGKSKLAFYAPIFSGPMPPKDWVATTTGKSLGVCINEEVYETIPENKRTSYIGTICRRVLYNGPISAADREFLDFLKGKGLLE